MMNKIVILIVLSIQYLADFSNTSNYSQIKLNLALNIKFRSQKFKQVNGVCNVPQCNRIAGELNRYIDPETNPCRNFYTFCCGKFIRNTQLNENEDSYGFGDVIQEKIQRSVKNLLENQSLTEIFETQLRVFYDTCMDSTNIIERGSKMHLMLIAQNFGGWPMLLGTTWNENNFNMIGMLAAMIKHGIEGLFKFELENDPVSNLRYLKFSPPDLTYNPREYVNPSYINTLIKYMRDLALTFDDHNRMLEFVNQSAIEMKDLESGLAECRLKDQTDGIFKLHLLRIRDKFKNVFDMVNLVREVFADVGITISVYKPVFTYTPDYFECLPEVLERTHKKVLSNFLIFKLIHGLADAMPVHIFKIKHKFVTSGSDVIPSRWEICYPIINEILTETLLAMYVRKHFKPFNRKRVSDIIRYIKRAIKQTLSENTWLKPATINTAKTKIDHLDQYLGYPAYFDDPNLLNVDYINFTFSSDNFVFNLYEAKRLKTRKILKGYGKLYTVRNDEIPTMDTIAYVDFYSNAMVYPISSLEKPYYSETYPMYLNFGAIGSLMGHEIIHAIDTDGRRFDNQGKNVEWWTESDYNGYVTNEECIINQYNTFKLYGKRINGTRTALENVAESEGVRASLRAYMDWLRNNGKEPMLPNLNFTNEQMFFISFGRSLCEKVSQRKMESDIEYSYSAPNMCRVIGPIQNSIEFAEAFNCPRNSQMNPSTKCLIF